MRCRVPFPEVAEALGELAHFLLLFVGGRDVACLLDHPCTNIEVGQARMNLKVVVKLLRNELKYFVI